MDNYRKAIKRLMIINDLLIDWEHNDKVDSIYNLLNQITKLSHVSQKELKSAFANKESE